MPELQQIFLTSGLTICGGIFLLVGGQIIIRFFVEPIHEQRKLIGEIADVLVYYANVYSNPGIPDDERCDDASRELRQKASQLRAKTSSIAWYGLFSFFRFILPNENIEIASSNLIGLSNSVHRGDPMLNGDTRDVIIEALKLSIYE